MKVVVTMAKLIESARKQAEMNRTEGWNGNDCDTAMRQLNALADALEASLVREEKLRETIAQLPNVDYSKTYERGPY